MGKTWKDRNRMNKAVKYDAKRHGGYHGQDDPRSRDMRIQAQRRDKENRLNPVEEK